MLIRVNKSWDYPDLMRQTPNNSGIWRGLKFTLKAVNECDFLISLNPPTKNINVKCPTGNKWLLIQESPIKTYDYFKKSYNFFDRVYSFDKALSGSNIINNQTALPWHIGKSYDELVSLKPNKSSSRISWITSNYQKKEGQKIRMKFKDFLVDNNFKFDLWGKGFNYIPDKFDALYNYNYSIAFENYSVNDYWTEKIADCFLSWTMPIYFGCNNITKYFPKESMILVDPTKPEETLEIIKKAIKNKAWEKNLKHIKKSRELILNQYQFFPHIYNLVQNRLKGDYNRDMVNFRIPGNVNSSQVDFASKIKNKIINIIK